MARKHRIEYPGAIYHVINRGNYRRDLFETPGAAESFLATLAEAVKRHEWKLFAYILMRNHFHLAIETTKPNLVDGMQWLQSTVASRFNRFRQENGHLFQGRYKSILVEDFSALARVVDYIHLNPVRAKTISPDQLCNYRWSSLFRLLRDKDIPGLTIKDWLNARGGWNDNPDGRVSYRKYLEGISLNESEQEKNGLVGLALGWSIGTPGWSKALAREYAQQKLLVGMGKAEIQELKHATWEGLLNSALAEAGKSRSDLETRPRVNSWKLQLASELRNQAAPVSWIAEQLKLGKPSSVRSHLSRVKRKNQQTAA